MEEAIYIHTYIYIYMYVYIYALHVLAQDRVSERLFVKLLVTYLARDVI